MPTPHPTTSEVYADVTIGQDSDNGLGLLTATASWVESGGAQAQGFESFDAYLSHELPDGARRLSQITTVPDDAMLVASVPADQKSVDITRDRGSYSYLLVYGVLNGTSIYLGSTKLLDATDTPPRVIIPMTGGLPAGQTTLGLTWDPDTLEILTIDDAGGLAAWNAANAGDEIKVGDTILEVNGLRDASAIDAMLQDIEDGSETLTSFSVSRPATVSDLTFTDTSAAANTLSGTIAWTNPEDVGTVEGYNIYLSTDEAGTGSSDTLIGTVGWDDNTLPISDVARGSDKSYIVVKPYNGNGDSTDGTGILVFDDPGVGPGQGVTGVSFTDGDDRYRYVSGVASWTPPTDLGEVTYYAVYFGNMAGAEQQVDANIPVGTNSVDVPAMELNAESTYLIVYAGNPLGRIATYGTFFDNSTVVPPGSASAVALSDEDFDLNFIGGPITWSPPTYFADVTKYEVYLASGAVGDLDVTHQQVGSDVPIGTNEAELPSDTALADWEYVEVMTKNANGVQRGCYEYLLDTTYQFQTTPIPHDDDMAYILNADSFQIAMFVTPDPQATFALPWYAGDFPNDNTDVGIAVAPGNIEIGRTIPAGATARNSILIMMADGNQFRTGFFTGWPEIEGGERVDFKLYCHKVVGARECSVTLDDVTYGPLKFRDVTGSLYGDNGASFGGGFFGTLHGLTLCDGGLVRASALIADRSPPVAAVSDVGFTDSDTEADSLTGDVTWVPATGNDPPVISYGVFFAQASATGAEGLQDGLYEFIGSVPYGTNLLSISSQAIPSGATKLAVFTENEAGFAGTGAVFNFTDIATPPSTVTNLEITLLATGDYAELTWTEPSDVAEIDTYEVYLSSASTGGTQTLLESIPVGAVSYTIENIPSSQYSFVLVYSANQYGSGLPNAVELPANSAVAPTVSVAGLTFFDDESDGGLISGALSWTPPGAVGTVTSYKVYLAASETPDASSDVLLEEVAVGTNVAMFGASLSDTYMYLAVYTANDFGMQDEPATYQLYDRTTELPTQTVSDVSNEDTDEAAGMLAGTISWVLPPYYAAIDTWEIYFAEDDLSTEGTLIASVPRTSTSYNITTPIALGNNANIQIYGRSTPPNEGLLDNYASAPIEELVTTATATASSALPAVPYSRIEFLDTDVYSTDVSGVITVDVAGDDSSDAQSYYEYWGQYPSFTVYWGSDPTNRTELLATLEETSGDLQLTVPVNPTTLPFPDTYLLAYTMATDGSGEALSSYMLVVDRVTLPPDAPAGLQFADADPDEDEIGGTVVISQPDNAAVNATGYTVYLDAEQLCSVSAEEPVECFVPADTPLGGGNLTAYALNGEVQSVAAVTLLVNDVVADTTPPQITFQDVDDIDGAVGGFVTIPSPSPATSRRLVTIEANETHYYLYWGMEGCNHMEFLGSVYIDTPPTNAPLGLCTDLSFSTAVGCLVPDGSLPPSGSDAILAFVASNTGAPVAIPTSSSLPSDVISMECSMVRLADTVALPPGWTLSFVDTDAIYRLIGGTATVKGPATGSLEYMIYLGDATSWFGAPVSVVDAKAAAVITGLPVTIPQGTPMNGSATHLHLVTEVGALTTSLANVSIIDEVLYAVFEADLNLYSASDLSPSVLSAKTADMECDIAVALAVDCTQVKITSLVVDPADVAALAYTVTVQGLDEAERVEDLLEGMNDLQGAVPVTSLTTTTYAPGTIDTSDMTTQEALSYLTQALRTTLNEPVFLQALPPVHLYEAVAGDEAMPFANDDPTIGAQLPLSDTRTASATWLVAGLLAFIGTMLVAGFALRCSSLLLVRKTTRKKQWEERQKELQARQPQKPAAPQKKPAEKGGKDAKEPFPDGETAAPEPGSADAGDDANESSGNGNWEMPDEDMGIPSMQADMAGPVNFDYGLAGPQSLRGRPRPGELDLETQSQGTAVSNWDVMQDEEVEGTLAVTRDRLLREGSPASRRGDLDDTRSVASGWTVGSDARMDGTMQVGRAGGSIDVGPPTFRPGGVLTDVTPSASIRGGGFTREPSIDSERFDSMSGIHQSAGGPVNMLDYPSGRRLDFSGVGSPASRRPSRAFSGRSVSRGDSLMTVGTVGSDLPAGFGFDDVMGQGNTYLGSSAPAGLSVHPGEMASQRPLSLAPVPDEDGQAMGETWFVGDDAPMAPEARQASMVPSGLNVGTARLGQLAPAAPYGADLPPGVPLSPGPMSPMMSEGTSAPGKWDVQSDAPFDQEAAGNLGLAVRNAQMAPIQIAGQGFNFNPPARTSL